MTFLSSSKLSCSFAGTNIIAIVNGVFPREHLGGKATGELKLPSKAGQNQRVNEPSFEEMLKDAANLPPKSAIFWDLFSVDAVGVAHEANAVLHRFSATANVPTPPDPRLALGRQSSAAHVAAQEGSAVAAAAAFHSW